VTSAANGVGVTKREEGARDREIRQIPGELEAAEEAADAAAREARRVVREKRKAELHAGVDKRVGKLKEKLHVS
jgi:hypothetical protein